MQVFIYDENKIYIKTYEVEELGKNMTTVSPLSGDKTGTIPYRPRFDEENQVWVEDMTEEEIKAWEESNKIDICLEPTEMQILQEQVTKLIINQL